MSFLSISSEIASFSSRQDKRYDTAYADVGFELGFGRAGSYRGHSHMYFVDLMFAPDGICWRGRGSTEPTTLVIVPARTYLPNLKTGDFMFLKFCPDDTAAHLPDKVHKRLYEQHILAFTNQAKLTFPWYRDPSAERQNVEVTLRGAELTIEIGRTVFLVVRR